MKDTGAWFAVIPVGCLIFLYAAVLFPMNNFYSKSVHAASPAWQVAGWLLTAACIVWFVRLKEVTTGKVIIGGMLLALSICSFSGFDFQFA